MFAPLQTADNLTSLNFIHGFFAADTPPEITPSDHLLQLKQVHSADAIFADLHSPSQQIEADGMITREKNLGLCIYTADCVPVLFAAPEHGIIGACHAGWRGAVKGICQATLKKMMDAGANPNSIAAAIGPAIQQDSFQVDARMRDEAMDQNPRALPFFVGDPQSQAHWRFDLPGFVEDCLKQFDIQNIWRSQLDTYSHPKLASYRRATHQNTDRTPRQISMIMQRVYSARS